MKVTDVYAIGTVGALRAVLAELPDDTVTGPYFAEYSPSDRQFDLHPTETEEATG
jgi:hypothetical protein